MPPQRNPLDRRSHRTRRHLKEALFALILEKGYDAVKIEDITERADIGRTTFYLHYRDKEELLLESIDSITEELLARLPPPGWRVNEPGGDGFVLDAILITFRHAYENAQLYRVILRGAGASRVSGRLHHIISQRATALIAERAAVRGLPLNPQVPLEVFANYFAGALMALVTWWLEAGAPYPPDEMAHMFHQMFFAGGRNVLRAE